LKRESEAEQATGVFIEGEYHGTAGHLNTLCRCQIPDDHTPA
jgi:hypothetical protein